MLVPVDKLQGITAKSQQETLQSQRQYIASMPDASPDWVQWKPDKLGQQIQRAAIFQTENVLLVREDN